MPALKANYIMDYFTCFDQIAILFFIIGLCLLFLIKI